MVHNIDHKIYKPFAINTASFVTLTSYCFDSMAPGYHKYMHVWDAAVSEILSCSNEDTNLHEPYVVAIKKDSIIVDHV